MSELRRTFGSDGRELWVDEHGLVHGEVKTGHPREDVKEYAEREPVERLVDSWGWPANSKIQRPATSNYDFDCERAGGLETAAVEVKRLMLPEETMAELARHDTAEFQVRDFVDIPHALVSKADNQLAGASADRRCVLLVWQMENPPDDYWWKVLKHALGRLDRASYTNVDEIYLATSHLRQFYRL